MSIAVLGAGSWGTALAILLARNGADVVLWCRDADEAATMQRDCCNAKYLPGSDFPPTLTVTTDLAQLIASSDDVLFAVPSHAFRSILVEIKPHLKIQTRLVSATKGLDPETGKLLHDVVTEVIGDDYPFAVLSGPSFAREVAAGLPTAVVIATEHEALAEQWLQYLSCETFRVYTNDDLVGVQLGGAIKNVMAVAAGISDGLGFGCNARSALLTRGMTEMIRLSVVLGAAGETLFGLTGMGDLILTCTDDQSRNRRFGLALGQGATIDEARDKVGQVVEGYGTAAEVYRLARHANVDMPITEQVYQVLYEHKSPRDAVSTLFARAQKAE